VILRGSRSADDSRELTKSTHENRVQRVFVGSPAFFASSVPSPWIFCSSLRHAATAKSAVILRS